MYQTRMCGRSDRVMLGGDPVAEPVSVSRARVHAPQRSQRTMAVVRHPRSWHETEYGPTTPRLGVVPHIGLPPSRSTPPSSALFAFASPRLGAPHTGAGARFSDSWEQGPPPLPLTRGEDSVGSGRGEASRTAAAGTGRPMEIRHLPGCCSRTSKVEAAMQSARCRAKEDSSCVGAVAR